MLIYELLSEMHLVAWPAGPGAPIPTKHTEGYCSFRAFGIPYILMNPVCVAIYVPVACT